MDIYRVGLDDSDTPERGCTSDLIESLVCILYRDYQAKIYRRYYVRLNPDIADRTRGNGAFSLEFGVSPGVKVDLGLIYLELSREAHSEEFGMALCTEYNPAFYLEAISRRVTRARAIENASAVIGGKGVIGATAACHLRNTTHWQYRSESPPISIGTGYPYLSGHNLNPIPRGSGTQYSLTWAVVGAGNIPPTLSADRIYYTNIGISDRFRVGDPSPEGSYIGTFRILKGARIQIGDSEPIRLSPHRGKGISGKLLGYPPGNVGYLAYSITLDGVSRPEAAIITSKWVKLTCCGRPLKSKGVGDWRCRSCTYRGTIGNVLRTLSPEIISPKDHRDLYGDRIYNRLYNIFRWG